MATVRAIDVTCQTVMDIVEREINDIGDLATLGPDFPVLDSRLNEPTPTVGVSLLPYRVFVDEANRTPPGVLQSGGGRRQPELPVALHFMISAWANDASTQLHLLAAAMRVIEDHPILRASELNVAVPQTFRDSEDVQLAFADLSTEDMTRLWDALDRNVPLSVPYAARGLRIESTRTLDLGPEVQDRVFQHGTLEPSS